MLVELHSIMNSFPRVGKERCDVYRVRREPYVLVSPDEFNVIPFAFVEGGYLQKPEWRIAGIVVRLN